MQRTTPVLCPWLFQLRKAPLWDARSGVTANVHTESQGALSVFHMKNPTVGEFRCNTFAL